MFNRLLFNMVIKPILFKLTMFLFVIGTYLIKSKLGVV